MWQQVKERVAIKWWRFCLPRRVLSRQSTSTAALLFITQAKIGSCRVVELLLAVAASPEALLDARDEEGHTALLSAIKARHTVKVNNTVKASNEAQS